MYRLPNAQEHSDTIASSDIAAPGDKRAPTRLTTMLQAVFTKATLVNSGYHLYTQIWDDQPPCHTILITHILEHANPAAIAADKRTHPGSDRRILEAFSLSDVGVRVELGKAQTCKGNPTDMDASAGFECACQTTKNERN